MKKNIVLLAIVACFLCGIANCCAEGEIISSDDFKTLATIPVYVLTKGNKGSPLGGGKDAVSSGQYIVGKEGQLICVTGLTTEGIFKAGLLSYGITGEHVLKKASRYPAGEVFATVYFFDYK